MSQPFARIIKRLVLGLCVAGLLIGLIPMRYLAAPQWDVWVKNEAGSPLPGLDVRLSYENYSAESESHEITLVTDQAGHVAFQPQFRTASLLQRAFYTAWSSLAGVHASFGNHAFVFVFGGDYEGDALTGHYVTDWTGLPPRMTSTIVAKPVSEPRAGGAARALRR
jgi:hypothetical protein